MVWPTGIMPMTLAVPPRRSMLKACSAVFDRPMASKECCTPPLVISMTSLTTSVSPAAQMKSVAPNALTMFSLPAAMSMAMIRPAPAIAAPLIAARPTPPQPITATVSPGRTFEVCIAAPTPVITPHPISAARSSGMSLRIATQACSWISICSAKDERFRYCIIGPLAEVSRGSSSWLRLVSGETHRLMWPVRQNSQCPQKADRQVMTWSPGFTVRTSEPTCSTTPALSWPSTAGSGWG